MAKNKTDSIEFSSVAVGFAIYHNPVKVGLIAKKHAERCGIKFNISTLYTFKAFQHTEKAICESNCKDRLWISENSGKIKIAETVLVSAICLILPVGFVTPERTINLNDNECV